MPEFIITNIRIETEKHKRLKHIAVDNGISFTELIRQVIDGFLENSEEAPLAKPVPRARTARPRVDRETGGDSSEDGRIIIR